MPTSLRLDSTRFLHLTIIALQIFSVVQVVWWFVDQRGYADQNTNQFRSLYARDIAAAQQLVDLGVSAGEVIALFPHAEIADGQARLEESVLPALEEEQRSHVRQYAWESGFFLFVLASCIAVLWRGLNTEAKIRDRQDNFLAMVSHQFKTPLASLQLSLETMLMRELSADRFQQLSRRMLDDLRRMEGMVSKILDSARLDRGRVQLNRERVNLSEAVRHVLSNVEEAARRENINVDVDIPAELEIVADAMAVDTVL
ncbi:MAG: HAMP domain-containing sensor histidine kinase, partial [Rhodospirillaceae bacterium]